MLHYRESSRRAPLIMYSQAAVGPAQGEKPCYAGTSPEIGEVLRVACPNIPQLASG